MRRNSSFIPAFLALVLVLHACGSDDDPAAVSAPEAPATAVDPAAAPDDEPAASPPAEQPAATEASSDDVAPPPPGQGTATVTLDNGESWTFSVLCNLQPQESAGSTIEFTLVSYDDPVNLDVTQFGADSFNGAANISLYDSTTYDTLWEASSLFGSEVELTLAGSTVTGTGTFVEGEDFGGGGVGGELVANC